MKYTSNYKNIKVNEKLDLEIQEKFKKFEKYFDGEMLCHATIGKDGKGDDIKCVEISIKAGSQAFRADSTTDSFEKSVDEIYEKIKKQIRRQKDKTVAKRKVGE